MVLRRRNTVVGGKCALPSALLNLQRYNLRVDEYNAYIATHGVADVVGWLFVGWSRGRIAAKRLGGSLHCRFVQQLAPVSATS